MIVRKDKTYETNSMFPNTNWYDEEDNYVVDETTEDGRLLAQKIINNAPFMDLVIENGILVDIIPTEKPDPIIIDEEIDYEKVAIAEGFIDIDNRLKEIEKKLEGVK